MLHHFIIMMKALGAVDLSYSSSVHNTYNHDYIKLINPLII